MSLRVVVNGRENLEPASLVERRRLKGERHQHDLRAAPPTRLLLRGLEQLRTESAATLRRLDPELAHLTRAAPGVPADPRHDAILLAHEEREPLAVRDAGSARVELVNSVFQILHVVRSRVDRTQRDVRDVARIQSARPFHHDTTRRIDATP